jgi:hypothetical protein
MTMEDTLAAKMLFLNILLRTKTQSILIRYARDC